MKLTQEQVLGIIRHTLTFVGGIVIARGLADETVVNHWWRCNTSWCHMVYHR